MAEVLEMNVKSNIKSVTKDTQDWGKTLGNVNDQLDIQKKVIVDLEKELIKLKAKQDAIPKGAWVKGMDSLNDKIKRTASELKLEKIALKDLSNQQKEAARQVKNHTVATKGNNKESGESIANFHVMGVSLNGVKKGFGQIIPTAKRMFATIKAGIMSTGIGALALAVMALMQHFKRSEAGQEKFQRIMAAIGAVTGQVLDAFADLGGIIIKTFQDPMPAMTKFGKGLLKFLRDPSGATRDMFIKATLSAKGFVAETLKEVDALVEVTKERQKAHHIDRKLKVDRANANREINDIRLQAEDREKFNATERIALLRKAQAIEEGITAKEIQSKKILVDALKSEMKQGHNNIEIKDKLAQIQADLINLDTKKLRSQRLLQTQITTAVNQEKAIKEQAIKDDDAAWDKKIADNDAWNEKQIAGAKKVADTKMAILKAEENFKRATIDKTFGAAAAIAGENVALSKGVAAAQVIYNTQQGIMAAMAATSVADKLIPYPLRLANAIATGVMGAAALNKIMSTDPSAGSSAGGGGASAGSGTPAPQMMSGAFELTGAVEPEPLKAFVITDEMTSSQNQLANIRRRATI
tara:strand:+ start:164 stop:1909 length:1746 start_codon:yes stop_codon:yes gene_type:complete